MADRRLVPLGNSGLTVVHVKDEKGIRPALAKLMMHCSVVEPYPAMPAGWHALVFVGKARGTVGQKACHAGGLELLPDCKLYEVVGLKGEGKDRMVLLQEVGDLPL